MPSVLSLSLPEYGRDMQACYHVQCTDQCSRCPPQKAVLFGDTMVPIIGIMEKKMEATIVIGLYFDLTMQTRFSPEATSGTHHGSNAFEICFTCEEKQRVFCSNYGLCYISTSNHCTSQQCQSTNWLVKVCTRA